MVLTGEKKSTRRETCTSATLSTTDLARYSLGLNLSLCGERPATNCQSQGTQSSVNARNFETERKSLVTCAKCFPSYQLVASSQAQN